MTRLPEPEPGDAAVRRWLEEHQRALVAGLDDVLDVEAGLFEILLQSRHDAAVDGLGEVLDVEAGLREALGVRPDAATTAVPRPAPPRVTDPRLWSYKEIAALIGTQPDTVRAYRKHGLLPPPDLVEGGKPYWFADTVRAWVARRAGDRARRDPND